MDSKILSPINRRPDYFWQPFFIVLGILVVMMAIFCIDAYSQNCSLTGNKDQWKAVFVTNGQVYFGKIASETSKTVVLRSVYYLQVQQVSTQPGGKTVSSQSQYNILRLEDAIYRPTSEIRINRDQVLFIESLQSNSDVIKTIQKLSSVKK